MRRIIATLAAAGALIGGGFGISALTATAAVVPAVAAPAGQSHAQLVPRTHPNGKKLYTTIQVGSSWSKAVTPMGKKFQVQPNGKRIG